VPSKCIDKMIFCLKELTKGFETEPLMTKKSFGQDVCGLKQVTEIF